MFEGFTDRTLEFYMAIRFNNNRAFYMENRDWYDFSVKTPMLSLIEALAPVAQAIDDELDIRPERCLARIHRDTRFARDKAPYRDYSFMKFRRLGDARYTMLGLYFDLSDDGASYGMGIYDKNIPLMNGVRRNIQTDADHMCSLVDPVTEQFALHPNVIKRMTVPETVPEGLKAWYPLRAFYLEKTITDFSLIKSSALTDEIANGYRLLAPLYRYIQSTIPIIEQKEKP